MKVICCVCQNSFERRAGPAHNPTCSPVCRATRKTATNAQWREANSEHARAYDRAYQKARNAALSPAQKDKIRRRNKAWRKANRAKVLGYKRAYRESEKGKTTVASYLEKNADRVRAYWRSEQGRAVQKRAARKKFRAKNPDWKKRIAVRNLRNTETHKQNRLEKARADGVRRYYANHEAKLEESRRREAMPERAAERLKRRRQGAAAYAFLVETGAMQPARNDDLARRRAHTVARRVVLATPELRAVLESVS